MAISWKRDWPTTIFHMSVEMRSAVFESGLRFSDAGDAGSVAKASAAKVLQANGSVSSVQRHRRNAALHNQVDPEQLHRREDRRLRVGCDGSDKGDDDGGDVDRDLKLHGYIASALSCRENEAKRLACKNFLTESLTQRPHMMAETMLAKLSSIRMMSDASFATSVPAIPIEKPTFADLSAGESLVPSPVTPTTSPRCFKVSTKSFLSSGEERART